MLLFVVLLGKGSLTEGSLQLAGERDEQHPIGWLRVILIVTGIAGICPLYSMPGINTKSAAEKIGLMK